MCIAKTVVGSRSSVTAEPEIDFAIEGAPLDAVGTLLELIRSDLKSRRCHLKQPASSPRPWGQACGSKNLAVPETVPDISVSLKPGTDLPASVDCFPRSWKDIAGSDSFNSGSQRVMAIRRKGKSSRSSRFPKRPLHARRAGWMTAYISKRRSRLGRSSAHRLR